MAQVQGGRFSLRRLFEHFTGRGLGANGGEPHAGPPQTPDDVAARDDSAMQAWEELVAELDRTSMRLTHEIAASRRENELLTMRLAHEYRRSAKIVNARRAPASASGSAERADTLPLTDDYTAWFAATRPTPTALTIQRDMAKTMGGPAFSLIVPVYKLPLDILRETIESVQMQTYERWQLCIAHADIDDPASRAWLRDCAAGDERITLIELAENGGISANSNAALEVATGDFIVLLDHDDVLEPHALFAIASHLIENPATDFVYSDKDKTDAGNHGRFEPLFKPAWSPEAMLSVNYLTHVNALRTSIVREIGGWRSKTDGAQDWDLFFRFYQRSSNVHAIRDVLYHWRIIPSSVASGNLSSKPYALRAQIITIEDHLATQGVTNVSYDIEPDGVTLRPRFGRVRGSVGLIVVDDGSSDGSAVNRIISIAGAVSSHIDHIVVALDRPNDVAFKDERIIVVQRDPDLGVTLDRCTRAARCDVVILFDACCEIPRDGRWIDDLTGPLEIAGVGLVGGMALDESGERINSGYVFDRDGSLEAPFHFMWFGSPFWMRNFSAVSGFAMAVRTADLDAIGGFGERPAYPRRDVDLCLRLLTIAKKRIVYSPHARFVCKRPEPSLGAWLGDRGLGSQYIRFLFPDGDPHFHPSLAVAGGVVKFRLPNVALPPEEKFLEEARYLTTRFDASERTIADSTASAGPRSDPPKRIAWIVPDFGHAHYGGIATILRMASIWRTALGVEPVIVVLGKTEAAIIAQRVADAFPALSNIETYRIDEPADAGMLPAVDAAFATFWTTAYALLNWNSVARKCYFVQDFEPQFYPAGTTASLAQATYRFGFLAACNTISLKELYESLGGTGVSFTPAIEPAVFHRGGRVDERHGPVRIFAYMRPGNLRNGFELLTESLRMVKARFGNGVEIITAGADWQPRTYGLEDVVTNLGLLGYRATGALYRSIDIGTVVMMTSHPSYLPMELMACGAAVVTNHNERTRWLLRDGDNCFLAETTPSIFAERIGFAILNPELRRSIAGRGSEMVETAHSDWLSTCTGLYSDMFGGAESVR